MALSGMDSSMSLVKNEVQAAPAAVQRSSSLDSMQNPVSILPVPGNAEMLPTTMSSTPNANNSLSPPCQPVQRSRSLPLLDSSQGIPPELLADLTASDRGSLLGNNSVGMEDGLSTSQTNNQAGQFLQRDYLNPTQFPGLAQQPLNLSQSADIKQFLGTFQQPMVPRPNMMSRPVRNFIPHLGDWGGYSAGGRLQLRGAETTMAGLSTIGPSGLSQSQTIFNPSVANIYSKVVDKALGFPIGDTLNYGRENVHFPSGQPPMNVNPLRQQVVFEGKPSKDGDRQLHMPKDGRGNLVQAHQHHNENNNDKTSPNIQALSDSVGGHMGDKSMLPLSVSVSVAFTEPSQDSPASMSRHSNSPAMPYRTSADQMLSMINYNDDQLLQEHGLISDNSVTGTLDDNFLSGSIGIGHPSGSRLTDSSNLTGMDSSPPSVNNETFDLFDGGGDVDEASYMNDSLSPQDLGGDSDVHVTSSLSSMGSQSGTDVLASLPRSVGRGGFGVSGGKNPPDLKASSATGVTNDGCSTDVPPRRKGRPPSRNPGHRYSQPCQVCGKIFGSSSALAKHKLIHSSERRHKCVLCAKSFKRQDHLAGHMLTHRSKKPYECSVPDCSKSYCDIRSLRRHFESQHHGLVMEEHMKYTGDERDPELIAAEEAAAVQAQAQAQGQPSGLPTNSVASYMSTVNTLSSMPVIGSLTVNNFGQGGLMQQPSPQQQQQQQQQPQHHHHQQQQQQQQQGGGMNSTNSQSSEGQGSSSSAALQFLAQAAQRAQTNLPISATSPNNQSEAMTLNPQIPVPQDLPTLHRFTDLINPSGTNQLSSSSWNMTSQYEGLSNPRNLIMESIPAPRLATTMSTLSGNTSTRRALASIPTMAVDVRQPSPRGPSPAKSSDGKEKSQQPVECSVCKRMFKSMPALNGHMRLHGGYNNARGETTDMNKGDHSKMAHRQQAPTPPRTSQARSTPDTRGPPSSSSAPSTHSIPNHQSMMVNQAPVSQTQPALHVSVPGPSFPMPMSGLPQLPPMTQMPPLLNQLRPQQIDLPAQVKRELNMASVPKPSNPFFSDVSFSHPHHHSQQLPSSYPQLMPMPISHVKDMPFSVPMTYPATTSQTVQMVVKAEPVTPTAIVPPQQLQLQQQQMPVAPLFTTAGQHELSPPRLEAIKPSEDQNVFRNPPPPTQPSPTKKRPRPSPLHIPSCVNTGTPGGIIPGTYQSQMRSPRELGGFYPHHPYRSSGSGTTPPPYTPPPMLSPIRSGPGLYFNVGPLPMPSMTPKTPSMMSMHRRNSSAAPEEAVSDFVFSTAEPHINVGPEFQATIPDLIVEGRDESVEPDYRLGWLASDPSVNEKYTISEVTNFLMLAKTAALPGGAQNTEYAHHCLHRADGDIQLALKMLMNPQSCPEDNNPFNDYNYNFTATWSQGERKIFRDYFKIKGKDFHAIQKHIPTKPVKEIVEYYYLWKKLYPYNRDMQKFCHHSGVNPSEDVRRNECEEKPANQGPFTCNYPDCAATFKSRQALNGHIRVHGGSYKSQPAAKETRPVQRSVSPVSESTSTSGMSRRMSTDSSSGESMEPEPVTYPCKICGKVFFKVKSRSAHMKSHRKPDAVKKPIIPSIQEESPPEFGTESLNHYADDSEVDDSEDDDDEMNEELRGYPHDGRERSDDGSSSTGQSGSRSESSSGSGSGSESESESGNSEEAGEQPMRM
ncbi:uncharacterized protein LOC119741156 isoform X2 [Patiria miniata]|uniref:Transcriptional-regulating factor 1 n=1 Tax=Patiria miniata TaxID=46514 RepID=A0A914B9V9_PATMI|nr:uncharacterized protein LOC119741156 isoform X2 [Patiria miniata]